MKLRILLAAISEKPASVHQRYSELYWLYELARKTIPFVAVETSPHPNASRVALLQGIRDGERDIGVGHKDGRSDLDRLDSVDATLVDPLARLPDLLSRYPSIDLFYHGTSSPRERQMNEYRLVWPRLRRSGLLICKVPDWDWNGAFVSFAREVGVPISAHMDLGCLRKP